MPPKKEAKAKVDDSESLLEPDSDPEWQRVRTERALEHLQEQQACLSRPCWLSGSR